MKNKIIAAMVLCGIALAANPTTSNATPMKSHLNIGAIHANKAGYEFPAVLEGTDIRAQLPGTQYIFLIHTAKLNDGDAVMISSDTLREAKSGGLEDEGVDCQFSVSLDKRNEMIDLAGVCNFFLIEDDGTEVKSRGIIAPTTLAEYPYWVLLFEDSKTGIAIYAEVD